MPGKLLSRVLGRVFRGLLEEVLRMLPEGLLRGCSEGFSKGFSEACWEECSDRYLGVLLLLSIYLSSQMKNMVHMSVGVTKHSLM